MSKNEIEAKLLEVDKERVSEKIEDLGAKKAFEGKMRSEFYDFPDGRIEENGLLRLRTKGSESFITRKIDVSQDEVKEKEEIEFDVSSPEEAKQFLRSIGLEKIYSNEKKRTKWVKETWSSL